MEEIGNEPQKFEPQTNLPPGKPLGLYLTEELLAAFEHGHMTMEEAILFFQASSLNHIGNCFARIMQALEEKFKVGPRFDDG